MEWYITVSGLATPVKPPTPAIVAAPGICANDSLRVFISGIEAGNTVSATANGTAMVYVAARSLVYLYPAGAGTYSISITQTNSSNITSDPVAATATVSAIPAVPTVTITQPTCATPGSIAITNLLSGENWSVDGSSYTTNSSIGNLNSGTYNIYKKNSAGCVSSAATATINTAPSAPAVPTVSVTQPTCATPGSIAITNLLSGESWSVDGSSYTTNSSIGNLNPGTYNVYKKNSTGCVSSAATASINAAPSAPAVPTVSVTQPTCATPGSIAITNLLSGESWSVDGLSYTTNGSVGELASGTYNIYKKNSAGCVSSAATATINAAPSAPAVPTVSITQPTCATPGSIAITNLLSGESWSVGGSSYTTNSSIGNLNPGTYNVYKKNSAGCVSAAATATINTAPSAPAVPTVTITQPTCATPGSIAITNLLSGESWSVDGSSYTTNSSIGNLNPGTYSVYKKNGAGCVSTAATATINAAPSAPAVPTVNVTQPTCAAPGSIAITNLLSGESWSIDGSSYTTNNSISNLNPGTYNMYKKNSAGCVSAAATATINAAPSAPVVPTVSVTQPTCATPGSITITNLLSGESWSVGGLSYTTNGSVGELASGTYNIYKKNSAGCVGSAATVTITVPDCTPVISQSQNTMTTPIVAGAVYQWYLNGNPIGGATANSYTTMLPGAYKVSISIGTAVYSSATFRFSPGISIAFDNYLVQKTDATCTGQKNGQLVISAKQAFNYTVTISGPGGYSNSFQFTGAAKTISGLVAGTYQVCFVIEGIAEQVYKQCFTAQIKEPAALGVSSSINGNTTTLKKINLELSGGKQYNILLNGKKTITTASSVELLLEDGENTLKVTTEKECQGVFEKTISVKQGSSSRRF